MKKSALVLVGALGLILGFQNCGKMKTSGAGAADSSSSSSSSFTDITHTATSNAPTLSVYQNSNQVADNLSLAVNSMYVLKVEGDSAPVSVDWSAKSGVAGFANCALTGNDIADRSLSCSSIGLAHVDIVAHYSDNSMVSKSFERQVASTGTVLPPGDIVNFSINAGTAKQPWNTLAAPVVVFKGQTLHIVNNDTMVHRLHTNATPCPHEPANISTGQSYDCVIAAAHAANAGNMYDHNIGTSAAFYLTAYDGAALITQAQGICGTCGGILVKGVTLAQIKAAISSNSGGAGAITFNDDQLNAIVYQESK